MQGTREGNGEEGCLKSGSLEVEAEMGILVQVIEGAPSREGHEEMRVRVGQRRNQGHLWLQLKSSLTPIPRGALEHERHH